MRKEIDLCDLSAELSGISMILIGLANQLDEKANILLPDALEMALSGVSKHIDRIAEDLDSIPVK